MIMMISIVFLLTTYSSHSYFVPKQGVRRSLVTAAPYDIYSLLISDQFVKQITVPIALAVYFTSTVEKQIQLTKASTDKQITAIDNQILSNKELTEKQIQLNKELTEKQILSKKEVIEKQIQSNKEIILANHEISKEMIKSSEARIENILFRFNQNSLPVGERKGE